MAAFRLIPKEEKFYADFIALADRIVSGATLLEKMLATDPPAWEMGIEIKQVEEACDTVTHEIIQRLNRTFVTPIDREDIYALARSLDDVMDAIDAAAGVVRRYRIAGDAVRRRELASLIWRSAMQVKVAVEALEKKSGVHDRTVEINRLENDADQVHDEALRRLFEDEKDADHDHQVQGDARPPRAGDRSLRGRRQRPRERRGQARVAGRWTPFAVVVLVIVVALVFDYINGFHDAANSIATVVSTRVLSPGKAVIWAAFFNFAAAFGFGTAVAKTVGSGMIDLKVVTTAVILGGLIGAIVWDLITWYYGLPTSSSHALIGGYAGAAVAKAGLAAIIAVGMDEDAALHRAGAAHRPRCSGFGS